jgi:hypothetical protein
LPRADRAAGIDHGNAATTDDETDVGDVIVARYLEAELAALMNEDARRQLRQIEVTCRARSADETA